MELKDAGLKDICEWWIERYPLMIFVKEPEDVIEITKRMSKILEKITDKQY